jgi:hypothetical protein
MEELNERALELARSALVAPADERERELADAVVRLVDDRQRFRRLHASVLGALRWTRPPDDWRGVWAAYPDDIRAEPYSWLFALVNEAVADYHPDRVAPTDRYDPLVRE